MTESFLQKCTVWNGKEKIIRNITTINQIGSAGSILHDKMY